MSSLAEMPPLTLPRDCQIYGIAVHILGVRTVAETPIFQKYASDVWSDTERIEFINWIANNPEAGDVIPGSGGVGKFVGRPLVKVSAVAPG